MVKIGSKIDEVRVDGSLDALQRDLDHFASIGLDAVEIPVHGIDAIKDGKIDPRRLRESRAILSDYDFEYSVHAPDPLNLMDRDHPEMHIAVLRSSLQFTAEIGSRVLVYHAGRYVAEELFPVDGRRLLSEVGARKLLDAEVRQLRSMAQEFPDQLICVENARPYLLHSPYCYGESLESLGEIIREIDCRNVGVALDVGHLFMAAELYGIDPVSAVRNISSLIVHTHVHDNFGGVVHYHEKQQTHQIPFGRGDAHMPVGWGAVPISAILEEYLDSYTGILMMELHSRYFEYTGESSFNLRRIVSDLEQRASGKGEHVDGGSASAYA
ncbi:MAG: sugar phosphate isomerase/epimerase family protein [Syntrophobacteraceae bacterium]